MDSNMWICCQLIIIESHSWQSNTLGVTNHSIYKGSLVCPNMWILVKNGSSETGGKLLFHLSSASFSLQFDKIYTKRAIFIHWQQFNKSINMWYCWFSTAYIYTYIYPFKISFLRWDDLETLQFCLVEDLPVHKALILNQVCLFIMINPLYFSSSHGLHMRTL